MDFKPLRDHILQLAISGQIVPQLDSEPAVEQLGAAPALEEVPFAIPAKWKWVPLNTVAQYNPEVKAAAAELDVSFAPLEDLSSGFNADLSFNQVKPWSQAKKGYKRFQDGDVIFAKIHPSFQNRKSGLVTNTLNGIGCGSTEFCVYRCGQELFNKYLLWFFKSNFFIERGKRTFKGTVGQQRVNLDVVNSMYIPLPPIAEQQRIAAVVDDLFAHLEQMESAYSEFAGPMTEHFRNTALQMAISGQLVPQLDSEPEVKQIGSVPENVPFAIPEKWKWVELGKFLPFGRAKQVKPEQIPANSWLLGLEEIESNGGLIRKCYDWDSVNSNKSAFKAGNVLYSKMRPYLNKVIIADEDGFCSTELLVLDVNQAHLPLHAGFMLYFLRAPYFVSLATKHSHGQKPRLDIKEGKKFLVPVPPFEEQRRIVAKLEELFSGVDKLGSLVAFT